MAAVVFENVKVTGLACAVPAREERFEDFTERFGDDLKKFMATTGVQGRRLAVPEQTTGDLCYEAASRLLAHKGYGRETIDGVLLVTQTPDYDRPSTAFILHKRLGLGQNCVAMDINHGCTGFLHGLFTAAAMVRSGALKRVLLCCGEANDPMNTKHDSTGDLLFGDAGAAVLVETGEDTVHALMKADGEGYQAIIAPGIHGRVQPDGDCIRYEQIRQRMDGGAVFEFAITRVPRAFREFFDTFGTGIEAYDYCVLHQANLFINKHIAKKIRLPLEKMPISIDRYGNTSSATIPLTIADLCQREEVPDHIHFIASGFGIGLSWGVADFILNRRDILPIIETDAYFREAYTGV